MKVPESRFKRALLAAGIVAGVCGLAFGVFILRFVALVSVPEFPPPTGQAEAREQDLQVLELWARKDRSVTEPVRGRIAAALNGQGEPVRTLSDAAFELWVARTLAMADNAHTNVSPEARRARVNGVPVHFFLLADGLYVLEARQDHLDLIGARVLAIDGRQVSGLITALRPFHGGPEAFNRAHVALNLASPELLHAAGLAERPDRYELTLQQGPQQTRVVLEAEPPESVTPRGLGQVSALRREVADGWAHLHTKQPVPLLERVDPELGRGFLIESWRGGLYVRMDAHYDSGVSLSRFKRLVVQRVTEDQPDFLVLDLRLNRGGNWSTGFSKRVVGALRKEAHVFVLVSEHTFSAGIIEAALFKAAAEGRAIIVGDGPGDRLRFWANGGTSVTMPNSGIELRIWTGYEDWADGCSDWKRCFWITMFTGVAVGDLDPDIQAPLTFAAYASGDDPALIAAQRVLRGADKKSK